MSVSFIIKARISKLFGFRSKENFQSSQSHTTTEINYKNQSKTNAWTTKKLVGFSLYFSLKVVSVRSYILLVNFLKEVDSLKLILRLM